MINKKIIRPICLILCVIMMIGACGCMNSRRSKMSVDDCINYMVEKYGENFTYIEPYSDYQSNNSLKIIVQSESMPDSRVLVVSERVNDTILFHDNYIAEKYKEETFNLLQKLSDTVYGDCKVLYTVHEGFLPDAFNSSTDFATFISSKSSLIAFSVILPPNAESINKEDKIKEFYELLIENRINCSFKVYYINSNNKYNETLSIEQLLDDRDTILFTGRVIMDEDFSIKDEGWE